MPKTSDIDLGGYLRILLKGENGCGKTILSTSFPGPIYVFDFDGRMNPVKLMRPTRTDIEYDTYLTPDDFEKYMLKMQQLQLSNPFKTIVIGSLTSLASQAISYAMAKRPAGNEMDYGIIKGTDIAHFGAEARALLKTLQIIRQLKCHFILEAHIVTVDIKDISGKITGQSFRLMTGGKGIAAALPGEFNEIWYMNARPPVAVGNPPIREIFTVKEGMHTAKTALPLPGKIEIKGLDFFAQLEALLAPHNIKLAK